MKFRAAAKRSVEWFAKASVNESANGIHKRSETELLRAFRAGEAWAFETLFERFRAPLTRYFTSKASSAEDAQDLVQEVFIKAYRFREGFDPAREVDAWLWTIARNVGIDWSRGRAVEPSRARQGPRGETGLEPDFAERIPSAAPNGEELLERKFARRTLILGLRSLTASQRKVVWLRVFHQLSYEEISRRLGLSVAAVKCLSSRARISLKRLGATPG